MCRWLKKSNQMNNDNTGWHQIKMNVSKVSWSMGILQYFFFKTIFKTINIVAHFYL